MRSASFILLHSLIPALASVALIGCGTGPKPKPDAGPVDMFPADSTYWGLADQECFHFVQTAPSSQPAATAVLYMTLDTVTVGGVKTYQAILSGGLGEIWTDWFGFLSDNLVLYRQHLPPSQGAAGDAGVTSTQDTYVVYTPAPPYLVKDLAVGNTDTAITSAAISSATSNQTDQQTFTINVLATSPLMADGQQALTATNYVVSVTDGSNMTSTQVWFAPQLGIVQFTQPSSTGDVTFTLSSVSQNVPAGSCSP